MVDGALFVPVCLLVLAWILQVHFGSVPQVERLFLPKTRQMAYKWRVSRMAGFVAGFLRLYPHHPPLRGGTSIPTINTYAVYHPPSP